MEAVASSYGLERIGKWSATYLWLYLFGPLKQILSFAVDCNKKKKKKMKDVIMVLIRGLGGRCT